MPLSMSRCSDARLPWIRKGRNLHGSSPTDILTAATRRAAGSAYSPRKEHRHGVLTREVGSASMTSVGITLLRREL